MCPSEQTTRSETHRVKTVQILEKYTFGRSTTNLSRGSRVAGNEPKSSKVKIKNTTKEDEMIEITLIIPRIVSLKNKMGREDHED